MSQPIPLRSKNVDAVRQLEVFFEESPVPMAILTGSEHRFVVANPPYEKLVSRKGLVGKTILEAFSIDDVREFLPLIDRVYQSGEPYIGRGVPFKDRWLNFGYHPFRGRSGEVESVLVVIEDVTELVLTHQRLERSERELRDYLEAMPQMAFTADSEGAILSYNQRWFDYVGEGVNASGWDWSKTPIHHPDDLERTVERWTRSVRTGEPYEIEYRLRRHDGQYRWHLGRAVPIHDAAGRITRWVGTNTDIHEQRLLVEGLEKERDLRARFIATLSHDLRNPLAAAKISAQLIDRKAGDPAEVRKLAARVVHNMDRADGMIRDLLDASRLRSGEQVRLEVSPLDLVSLVKETLEDLGTQHGDRFTLEAPRRLEGIWSADALRRILENLCGNGIKYGDPRAKLTVVISADAERVKLSVHNEGAPIPEREQERLFDPFSRSSTAHLGGKKGWGLGLTLVKGLTEAQGGSVSVRSAEGAGTTFFVRLPRRVAIAS